MPIRAVKTRTLGVAVSHEEALPITPVKGGQEANDVASRSGTVTFDSTDVRFDAVKHIYGGAKPVGKKIAMPPGHGMERTAKFIFFFAPKRLRRILEEAVGDYRHEMVKAEADRRPAPELRLLRVQHWGGFFISVFDELLDSIVGRIIRAYQGRLK
jgi:hypothetical protein